MGLFRDLVQLPGAFRLMAAQLTARFPFGMLTILLLLHIPQLYGGFTSAGIVLASLSIGQAVSGPVATRLMGQFGMRRILFITTIICSTLLFTLATTHPPLPTVIALTFGIGITAPPIMPAVRTLYPKIVPRQRLSTVFSIDASAQELVWMLGPVVAVFIATQFDTQRGFLVAAAFMILGGVWLATSPDVRQAKLRRTRGRLGAVLKQPVVALTAGITFFYVAGLGALNASLVAEFGNESMTSGLLIGAFSLGSITGGIILGTRPVARWSVTRRALIVALGAGLCLLSFAPSWLAVTLYLSGFGASPMFAAVFMAVSAVVKFRERAEAFGWLGTGQLTGIAGGSAVAGILIDNVGPLGGLSVALGAFTTAVTVSCIGVRWMPDLGKLESFE